MSVIVLFLVLVRRTVEIHGMYSFAVVEVYVCYLFHQNGTILHRGPLVYMASMAISEVARGTNRGLYKDCLHAVYMPYCTSFFTRDKHFVQMANDDTFTHLIMKRLFLVKFFGLYRMKRNVEAVNSFA